LITHLYRQTLGPLERSAGQGIARRDVSRLDAGSESSPNEVADTPGPTVPLHLAHEPFLVTIGLDAPRMAEHESCKRADRQRAQHPDEVDAEQDQRNTEQHSGDDERQQCDANGERADVEVEGNIEPVEGLRPPFEAFLAADTSTDAFSFAVREPASPDAPVR
jgi:hypothetical protein